MRHIIYYLKASNPNQPPSKVYDMRLDVKVLNTVTEVSAHIPRSSGDEILLTNHNMQDLNFLSGVRIYNT